MKTLASRSKRSQPCGRFPYLHGKLSPSLPLSHLSCSPQCQDPFHHSVECCLISPLLYHMYSMWLMNDKKRLLISLYLSLSVYQSVSQSVNVRKCCLAKNIFIKENCIVTYEFILSLSHSNILSIQDSWN